MSNTLDDLKDYCAEKGLRVTPQRLLAFKIVNEATKPLTAYEVLDLMKSETSNPKPPTAYRALEFLEGHGFIHRIESLNAYVACDVNHLHDGSQFMICDECGNVEEVHLCSLPNAVKTKIDAEHFSPGRWSLEVHGKCRNC